MSSHRRPLVPSFTLVMCHLHQQVLTYPRSEARFTNTPTTKVMWVLNMLYTCTMYVYDNRNPILKYHIHLKMSQIFRTSFANLNQTIPPVRRYFPNVRESCGTHKIISNLQPITNWPTHATESHRLPSVRLYHRWCYAAAYAAICPSVITKSQQRMASNWSRLAASMRPATIRSIWRMATTRRVSF